MSEARPRLVFPTKIKIEHMPLNLEQDIDYRRPVKSREQLRAEGHPFRTSTVQAQLNFSQKDLLAPVFTGSNEDTALRATITSKTQAHFNIQTNDFIISYLDKTLGLWVPVELRILHVKPTAQKSRGHGLYHLICKDDSKA